MNQVTNKIPFGLLSEEDQAQFLPENRRLYEVLRDFHGKGLPIWESTSQSPFPQRHQVYRLIIKDDEWYYSGTADGRYDDVRQAKDFLGSPLTYEVLRPATAAEIEAAKPKELTLEEKVKAKYPDYEVCMIKYDRGILMVYRFGDEYKHIEAQSFKGFYKYVYHYTLTSRQPIIEGLADTTIQPIAVLFTRDK